jgi:hypothetical protein
MSKDASSIHNATPLNPIRLGPQGIHPSTLGLPALATSLDIPFDIQPTRLSDQTPSKDTPSAFIGNESGIFGSLPIGVQPTRVFGCSILPLKPMRLVEDGLNIRSVIQKDLAQVPFFGFKKIQHGGQGFFHPPSRD